jgi:hypothetical protein
MVMLSFGRSETVPVSEVGATTAPSVVVLDQVSITGSEYPQLYWSTSHVLADMLGRRNAEVIVMQAKRSVSGRVQLAGNPFPTEVPEKIRQGLASLDVIGHMTATDISDVGRYWSTFAPYSEPGSLDSEVRESGDEESSPDVGADDVEFDRLVAIADQEIGIPLRVLEPVSLTGNLPRDVLALSGLTAGELARVVGRTERSVRTWIATGQVPGSVRPLLLQLRTIAVRLVGGLGPDGVRRWLSIGVPSRLEQLANGDLDRVVASTCDLLDSPAT